MYLLVLNTLERLILRSKFGLIDLTINSLMIVILLTHYVILVFKESSKKMGRFSF